MKEKMKEISKELMVKSLEDVHIKYDISFNEIDLGENYPILLESEITIYHFLKVVEQEFVEKYKHIENIYSKYKKFIRDERKEKLKAIKGKRYI